MTRGPTPPRASLPTEGGQVNEIPISQSEAGEILGEAVDDNTWAAIVRAFEDRQLFLGQLDSMRANQNRNDPASYGAQRKRAFRTIERALDAVGDQRARTDFNAAATQNFRMTARGDHSSPSIDDLLNRSFDDLAAIVGILRNAEAQTLIFASEAEINREFARELRDALSAGQLPVKLSTGRELEELLDDQTGDDRPAENEDLTPFERLFAALRVMESASPSALSAWLRESLSRKGS